MVSGQTQPITDLRSSIPGLLEGRNEREATVIGEVCTLAFKSGLPEKAPSGTPSLQRAMSIAGILGGLKLDHETIAAAILRDLVEGRCKTLKDVEHEFGPSVAGLVGGLEKLDLMQALAPPPADGEKLEKGKKDKGQTETLRKMLLAMSEDLRAVLIKLIEHLYYMRTVKSFPEERRTVLARESLDIFAPLANRLGIGRVRWELEDLSFHYLDPETYKRIARLLDERRIDREANVRAVVERLKSELQRADIEAAEVTGRAKHIYSIWRKMTRKGVDFEQIFDVTAVRVLVPDVASCYATLGVVHTLWDHIRGEFDDYIATPKENGYKALHTAVIGPDGKNLEVQIRTFDMHKEAELGVAAHWSYKEGSRQKADFQKKIAWLRQVLEAKEIEGVDFISRFKSEMFQDRVYVLTPKGEVMDLPKGATPLDFAYHIHSEVGHRCRGAKVDGKIVPLAYELKSGERVEIMTAKQPAPSREWLNPHLGYLKTPRARAKVRQWFRVQDYDKNVSAGRAILDRELQRLGVTGANLEKLAQKFGKNRLEDFLEVIGRGDITPTQLSAAFPEAAPPVQEAQAEKATALQAPRADGAMGGVRILGVGNLLTAAAGCCQPLPEDPVIGYVTRGRGLVIHREDCPNFLRLRRDNPERVIKVDWTSREKDVFKAQIQVLAGSRSGIVKDVTAVFGEEKVPVISVKSNAEAKTGIVSINYIVEVANLGQLAHVLSEISQVPGVIEAARKTA
ncbi:MAG: bifunctional (p)ppGpp synthetase/guanosine-3',5'-bis(diphosphate) 3'-pyrophosphohydrolase [Acidobacteria bacterium]|nr:MAG: bifunctional (p)ppGpp synthetase/guanosine-3',5'-bis(diphosphate) 3'-pyrophosphohydrolase [Acidobacteriota bacterium]